jgi:hypothetical protein
MRVPPHLHFANHGLLSQLGSSDQGTGQLRSSWDTAAREQLPAGLPQRPVVHHSSTSSPAKLRFAGDAPSRAPKKKAAAKQPGGSSPAKAAAAALNSRAARDVPAAWQADSGVSRLQQQWCQQDVAPASSYGYAAGQEQARWHAGAAAKQAPSTRGINAAEARRAALARAAAKRSRQPGGPAGPAAEDSQVTVASQGAGAGPPSAAAGPAAADVSPTAEGVQQATRNGVSMATSMVFELGESAAGLDPARGLLLGSTCCTWLTCIGGTRSCGLLPALRPGCWLPPATAAHSYSCWDALAPSLLPAQHSAPVLPHCSHPDVHACGALPSRECHERTGQHGGHAGAAAAARGPGHGRVRGPCSRSAGGCRRRHGSGGSCAGAGGQASCCHRASCLGSSCGRGSTAGCAPAGRGRQQPGVEQGAEPCRVCPAAAAALLPGDDCTASC